MTSISLGFGFLLELFAKEGERRQRGREEEGEKKDEEVGKKEGTKKFHNYSWEFCLKNSAVSCH
jgi:hypothetical protein